MGRWLGRVAGEVKRGLCRGLNAVKTLLNAVKRGAVSDRGVDVAW